MKSIHAGNILFLIICVLAEYFDRDISKIMKEITGIEKNFGLSKITEQISLKKRNLNATTIISP